MVICANNHHGVDIVLPICKPASRKLSRHNVTAILIQVKNDKAFQHRIDKMLFDAMDPFRVQLACFLMGTPHCWSSEWSSPSPLINATFSFPLCLRTETIYRLQFVACGTVARDIQRHR
jgi:hypothetical protein